MKNEHALTNAEEGLVVEMTDVLITSLARKLRVPTQAIERVVLCELSLALGLPIHDWLNVAPSDFAATVPESSTRRAKQGRRS